MRRGKPSCHVAFDEATALLVGDSLQSLAFQILAEPGSSPTESAARYAAQSRAGRRLARHGGRASHRPRQRRQRVERARAGVHAHPQDRRADPRGGAAWRLLRRTARSAEQRKLDRFAKLAGLAFQVVDDLLDVQADTRNLGQDSRQRCQATTNLPTSALSARLRARKLAQELRSEALAALAGSVPRRLDCAS